MLSAHLLSLNAAESKHKGESVHIGVADSLYPLDDTYRGYEVRQRENYVASDDEETTGHGTRVFDYLRCSAENATYSFYRCIAENPDTGKGEATRGNLVEAIYDASVSGVDILNISAGVCHSEESGHDFGDQCRIADETRLAIEAEDLTVVAATGNESNADAVVCPALVDGVIGVGGYVSRCEAAVDRGGASSQYWVEGGDLLGPFCGFRGCVGDECESCRTETLWDGNVPFHNAVPDVLAPVLRVNRTADGPELEGGTSFAAPLVAGRLANILSDLRTEEDIDPKTQELYPAVRRLGTELDDSLMTKLDEQELFEKLSTDA